MQPGGPYPSLRGLMTWSVNWDASSCGNSSELSKAYAAYFASQSAARMLSSDTIESSGTTIAYFKNDVQLTQWLQKETFVILKNLKNGVALLRAGKERGE